MKLERYIRLGSTSVRSIWQSLFISLSLPSLSFSLSKGSWMSLAKSQYSTYHGLEPYALGLEPRTRCLIRRKTDNSDRKQKITVLSKSCVVIAHSLIPFNTLHPSCFLSCTCFLSGLNSNPKWSSVVNKE